MRLYTYLLILCICSEVSCTRHSLRYPRYQDFPEEKTRVAQSIQLDTALFRYPFKIAIKESVAIVMDLHNTDYFFHVFSFPGWKYQTSFGKRGEGPEEMLSADCFRFTSPNSIWTLDSNRMRIIRWRIESHLNRVLPVEQVELDKRLVRTLDFSPMEAGFLVSDYLGEYRYKRTDPQGVWNQSAYAIPTEKTYPDIALPALAQAWRSFIDYSPHKELLVMATQLGEVIEIYNLRDSSRIVRYGPKGAPEFQIAQMDGIPTGIMGFSDVHITDSLIYAVYHGRSFRDIEQALRQGKRIEDGGRFIYVFDLQGNPVRKYTLDRAIYGIDVHEESGTIFATDVNSDAPIVRFEL